MQRRAFLERLSCALAASALMPHALKAFAPYTAANLTIGPDKVASVPADFIGVSIESPQLYNPKYFSAQNKTLVDAFRGMTPNGVLRSGGHLSDVSLWKSPNGDFATPLQDTGIAHGKTYWEWKLTDPSVRDTRDGAITPESIRSLKGFLDTTGWKLIYGLNFGSGSPERAADEAQFVSKIIGDRLIAFQLGNEDDQLGGNRILRPQGYDFDRYFAEYQTFVQAVRKAVPSAKFGGPDVATNMDWVQRFAESPDSQAIFLSSHFYAMGPAKDPAMTAEFLLGPNARLARQIERVHKATAAPRGLPYRMTEGNSCFGGGKPNVSDGYASSLWGADYLLQCAAAGYAGTNLHGGGDGYYTSIAVGPELSTVLRPLYFGMQFASHFSGADLYPVTLEGVSGSTAYFGKRNREQLLAVINKGKDPLTVRLPKGMAGKRPEKQYSLQGPSLDATTGVTFKAETPQRQDTITVPGYSARLVQWS